MHHSVFAEAFRWFPRLRPHVGFTYAAGMLRLGLTYASLRFHSRFAHAYTFLIKLPRWPFALRPFGGARSAKAPPGCRGGTAFPRAALPSAPEMDLDSDSDSSKPDMRDDLDDSDSSSNAQGSSLGAERMGMQVRSSSSEDGSSPLESAHGMALDYDSATEAGVAGNRLLRSSGRARKKHRRARQLACLPLVVAVAIDPTCNSEGSLISRSSSP